MIGAEGCSTPAGLAGQVRPHRHAPACRGGSAPAPRKASILERKSTAIILLELKAVLLIGRAEIVG